MKTTLREKIKQVLAPKSKYLDRDGHEQPDPTPMAPPIGYNPQPSLRDQIRDMVRSEKLRLEAEAAGAETFEESNDFDVGDGTDNPTASYEVDEGDLAEQMLRQSVTPNQLDQTQPMPTPASPQAAQVPPEGGVAAPLAPKPPA